METIWQPKPAKNKDKSDLVIKWWLNKGKPSYTYGIFSNCQRDIWENHKVKISLTHITSVLRLHGVKNEY